MRDIKEIQGKKIAIKCDTEEEKHAIVKKMCEVTGESYEDTKGCINQEECLRLSHDWLIDWKGDLIDVGYEILPASDFLEDKVEPTPVNKETLTTMKFIPYVNDIIKKHYKGIHFTTPDMEVCPKCKDYYLDEQQFGGMNGIEGYEISCPCGYIKESENLNTEEYILDNIKMEFGEKPGSIGWAKEVILKEGSCLWEGVEIILVGAIFCAKETREKLPIDSNCLTGWTRKPKSDKEKLIEMIGKKIGTLYTKQISQVFEENVVEVKLK